VQKRGHLFSYPVSRYSEDTQLPHTGQSSQLSVDHNDRSAQFLPAVARSARIVTLTPRSRASVRKRLVVQRVTVAAHTGQSSQRVSHANDRKAHFLRTVVRSSIGPDYCLMLARLHSLLLSSDKLRLLQPPGVCELPSLTLQGTLQAF
jgi:hypothetical protein